MTRAVDALSFMYAAPSATASTTCTIANPKKPIRPVDSMKETYAPVICATTATTAVMIRPSVISPYALVTDARWAACTCSRL